ncbi:MAG: hypothetical protein LBD09_04245 [Treponema sp.]|nr:hypothetical protein [Treponema sp.]
MLLAFPGFASPTGAAFRLLDSRRGPGFRRADLRRAEPRRVFSQSAGALSEGKPWPAPEQWDFYNDFLDLFLDHGGDREKTGYGAALADLKRSGAVFTGLSGSGSACFGVFSRRKEARAAKKALAGGFYTLRDTFFLASPPKR